MYVKYNQVAALSQPHPFFEPIAHSECYRRTCQPHVFWRRPTVLILGPRGSRPVGDWRGGGATASGGILSHV
jgi:hypothetical protein